jgi:diacylglycerol kinase family enzyme
METDICQAPFSFYMSWKRLVLVFLALLMVLLVCGCTTSSPTTVQTAQAELVTVDINSTPHGAEVYFDGEYYGTTPGTLKWVSEGTHVIEPKHRMI